MMTEPLTTAQIDNYVKEIYRLLRPKWPGEPGISDRRNFRASAAFPRLSYHILRLVFSTGEHLDWSDKKIYGVAVLMMAQQLDDLEDQRQAKFDYEMTQRMSRQVVIHKDGDLLNNSPENLEVVEAADNRSVGGKED